MSTVEERAALEPSLVTPPPLLFSGATAPQTQTRARTQARGGARAHGAGGAVPVERRSPLSRAAAHRRTSWLARILAIVVLVVAIAGVLATIRDSKIAAAAHAAPQAHVSTLLSAQELKLGSRHRHRHRAHRG